MCEIVLINILNVMRKYNCLIRVQPCWPQGRNADRFRRNFQGVPWVEAPRVHWPTTSPRIITLSYLPGIKVRGACCAPHSLFRVFLVNPSQRELHLSPCTAPHHVTCVDGFSP